MRQAPGLKPSLLLFHESFLMAERSSGFRIEESGSAPVALMSSSTAASQEKVSRAEGTCGRARSLSLALAPQDQAHIFTLTVSCWSQGHTVPRLLSASDASGTSEAQSCGQPILKARASPMDGPGDAPGPAEAIPGLGSSRGLPLRPPSGLPSQSVSTPTGFRSSEARANTPATFLPSLQGETSNARSQCVGGRQD